MKSAVLLLLSAVLALVLANSPAAGAYFGLIHTHVTVGFGSASLTKSVEHWVNDGLMAVFFLLVGLEIKREFLRGELASRSRAVLPLAGALGGMLVPALIFLAFNGGTPTSRGWGIPMATDIAFALGILSLAGSRAPAFLRVFLAALAIIDDLGAVLVIALFYTSAVSLPALGTAAVTLFILAAMNRSGMERTWPYLAGGFVLWLAIMQSGVHATIAGVLTALVIPAAVGERLEHRLQPWVTYGIMPVFALTNAGVTLDGSLRAFGTHPLSLGILLGLVFGKLGGILGAVYVAVKCGAATLPQDVRWSQVAGVALLGGIGFTMSLFITALAFPEQPYLGIAKMSVLAASMIAGIAGYVVVTLRS